MLHAIELDYVLTYKTTIGLSVLSQQTSLRTKGDVMTSLTPFAYYNYATLENKDKERVEMYVYHDLLDPITTLYCFQQWEESLTVIDRRRRKPRRQRQRPLRWRMPGTALIDVKRPRPRHGLNLALPPALGLLFEPVADGREPNCRERDIACAHA